LSQARFSTGVGVHFEFGVCYERRKGWWQFSKAPSTLTFKSLNPATLLVFMPMSNDDRPTWQLARRWLILVTDLNATDTPQTNGDRTRGFSSFEDNQGQLPAGWKRWQNELGRTYYVDHNTCSTTWTRPSANVMEADQPTRTAQDLQLQRQRDEGRMLPEDHTGSKSPSLTEQIVSCDSQAR